MKRNENISACPALLLMLNRFCHPYATCKNATLRPVVAPKYAGLLSVGGKNYQVEIAHGEHDLFTSARVVLVDCVQPDALDEYHRYLRNRGWRLRVGLFDGKTTMSRDWRYFASSEEIDVFLEDAKAFICEHIDELVTASCTQACHDVDAALTTKIKDL